MSFLVWSLILALPALALGLALVCARTVTMRGMLEFCDSKRPAWVLTAIAWIWTAWECHIIGIAVFDQYLKAFPFELPILAAVLIPLTCVWMPKLLALRGVAAILMLFPCELFKCTRLIDSDWRLVSVGWAYILLTLGMFMMFYPWHVKTALKWIAERSWCQIIVGVTLIAVGTMLGVVAFVC